MRIGVDIDERTLFRAKKKDVKDLTLVDMFNLLFRKKTFEGIFFSHVIEHFFSYGRILSLIILFTLCLVRQKLVVITSTLHRDFWTQVM